MTNRTPEEQTPPRNVLEVRAQQLRQRLTGAEVKSAKEQRLLEATKVHIDKYQEVVYEHAPDGAIKKGPDGQPIEKSSADLHELLIRVGSPHLYEEEVKFFGRRHKEKVVGPNPEYDPHGALICAQVLSERVHASIEAKQTAHAGDLETAIQVFHDTKAESELLFKYGKGRQYREMPVPRPADSTHPDLKAISTALEAYQRNNERAERGKTALYTVERTQTVRGYKIPDELARREVRQVLEFYGKRGEELARIITEEETRLMSQGIDVEQNPPEHLIRLKAEYSQLYDFFSRIHSYVTPVGVRIEDLAYQHIERRYSTKEKLSGPLDADGNLDTDHLRRLREIQEATAEFVLPRQTKILGEQRVATQVLGDNEVSGYNELQELAFYREQYQAHEKKWLKEMGGDRAELQRRIEQWQRWGEDRERAAEGAAAAEETINLMELFTKRLWESSPEELAAMKTRIEVMQAFVKFMKEVGATKEQLQEALGIAPERAAALAPTVVLIPEQAAEQTRWISQLEQVRKLSSTQLDEIFLRVESQASLTKADYEQLSNLSDEECAEIILEVLSNFTPDPSRPDYKPFEGFTGNPHLRKDSLVEIIALLRMADSNFDASMVREVFEVHREEVFPIPEAPAPAARAETEQGGFYLTPEQITKFLQLALESNIKRGEQSGDFKKRIDQSLESGDWYTSLAEFLGEEQAARVAGSARNYARSVQRLSIWELLIYVFNEITIDLSRH